MNELTLDLIMECVALFFGTYLHEDVSVVAGALLVINQQLPVYLVVISILGGVISGDALIYGIGAAARKIPWVHKKLISPKIEKAKRKLEDNLTLSILSVRFIPTLLFPTFVACGLTGIPFWRFFLISSISGTIWSMTLLTVVIKMGHVVVPHFGYLGWIFVISFALLIITFKSIRPRRLRLSTGNMELQATANVEIQEETTVLSGMPPLKASNHRVAASEKIPVTLFYTPIALQWIWLGIRYRSLTLPTVANPLIEAGGMWGESKSRLMNSISPESQEYVSQFFTVKKEDSDSPQNISNKILAGMEAYNMQFPLVVKPDIGWLGLGVRVIKDEKMLLDYMKIYPAGLTIIVQRLIPFKGEAGVFYIKKPGEKTGKVTSLTIRYFPYVIGDGSKSISQLIDADERLRYKSNNYYGKDRQHLGLSAEFLNSVPKEGEIVQIAFIGSIRVGGLYINGEKFITKALNDRFEKIAGSIPEFYFGRFDIKFKSIDLLMQGTDFKIFEINGAGSEAIHVWDADMSLKRVFGDLFSYQSLLFKIGHLNRKRGYKPMSLMEFYRFTKNYNKLMQSYPPSQ